jgi:hypothetical protein
MAGQYQKEPLGMHMALYASPFLKMLLWIGLLKTRWQKRRGPLDRLLSRNGDGT